MSESRKYRNRLLGALPAQDLEAIFPDLVPVTLARRTQLETPNKKIGHVYFLESGIVSVLASQTGASRVEVGIIGREGMTGLPIMNFNDRHPYCAYIQVEATAYRMEVEAFLELIKQSRACRRVFYGFSQAFLIQTSETLIANAKATIVMRLARWLLMAQDRVEDGDIPLTHDDLALMTGAHRPGVTDAIAALSQQGMIAGKRGAITILDRDQLIALADRFYGIAEFELDRILKNAIAGFAP